MAIFVTVFEEEENCIVCLEMRADRPMRHLILGELTNYEVVCTMSRTVTNLFEVGAVSASTLGLAFFCSLISRTG
jgi:hypothetical protein